MALARHERLNAMDKLFFEEVTRLMAELDGDGDVRAIIVHQGQCRLFSAGLDLSQGIGVDDVDGAAGSADPARRSLLLDTAIGRLAPDPRTNRQHSSHTTRAQAAAGH